MMDIFSTFAIHFLKITGNVRCENGKVLFLSSFGSSMGTCSDGNSFKSKYRWETLLRTFVHVQLKCNHILVKNTLKRYANLLLH